MFITSEVALGAIISSSFQSITLLLRPFNTAGAFVWDLIVDLQQMSVVRVSDGCTGWICWWLVAWKTLCSELRTRDRRCSVGSLIPSFVKLLPGSKAKEWGEEKVKRKETTQIHNLCSSAQVPERQGQTPS